MFYLSFLLDIRPVIAMGGPWILSLDEDIKVGG
jgi:hypothetical protein